MGQVALARMAKDHLRDGGSITLTTGVLAMHPMAGSASVSLVNAGLEGFVRAAALEMPHKIRINAVSPPWVKETMVKYGMDPTPGLLLPTSLRPTSPLSRVRIRARSSTPAGLAELARCGSLGGRHLARVCLNFVSGH